MIKNIPCNAAEIRAEIDKRRSDVRNNPELLCEYIGIDYIGGL